MVNKPLTIGAVLRVRLIKGLQIRHTAIAARAIRLRMAARTIRNKRIAGRRGSPLMIVSFQIIGTIAGRRMRPQMLRG